MTHSPSGGQLEMGEHPLLDFERFPMGCPLCPDPSAPLVCRALPLLFGAQLRLCFPINLMVCEEKTRAGLGGNLLSPCPRFTPLPIPSLVLPSLL